MVSNMAATCDMWCGQVCDWPHNVIQTRPECRNIEQIILDNNVDSPFLAR